ncbi:sigma-E factor regulatory protein RseB domain-containing protein [Fredinandcohnia salidurans]|uniref:Sigma-E factor regulatory protein RseB domain-containing protein n=1 Tax=Fredinandcohnia salidurans TaxID=2595041 RepID=A0ABW4MTE6_9BACI
MEDKLKELKSTLRDSLTNEKNIHFTEEHKNRVLKTIKINSIRNNFSRSFNSRIHLLFSVVITFVLLVGTYFIAGIDDIFSKNEAEQIYKGHETSKITSSPKKDISQNTVIVPPSQEENYVEITKEEVYKKLLSSDKFETAKGEFELHYEYIDGQSSTVNVKYALSWGQVKAGFSEDTNHEKNSKEDDKNYTYFGNGKLWSIQVNTKTYNEGKYIEGSRPLIGLAQNSLFPREITLNYLGDFENWEIENQNEEILSHNSIVIKGDLNEYAAEKHSSKTFRFWIDKDSGVLLKYETYNKKGEVVDYLYPIELQINVPIDTKLFLPNLEGYKKIE